MNNVGEYLPRNDEALNLNICKGYERVKLTYDENYHKKTMYGYLCKNIILYKYLFARLIIADSSVDESIIHVEKNRFQVR